MNKKRIGLLAVSTFLFLFIIPLHSYGQSPTIPADKSSSGFPSKITNREGTLTINNSTHVESQDMIAIAISVISLILSIAVAYVSNFRRANIKLCFGRNLIFYNIPITASVRNGTTIGIGFNLPITFYNWSPQGATIQRIRLVIVRKDQDDCYDMAWITFVKFGDSGNFDDENLAQPIALAGRSSLNKIVRFEWNTDLGGKKLDIQIGNYELRIYGWTQNTEKPDLKCKASFEITDINYQNFNKSIASDVSVSIWLSLNENENPNQLVSRKTIDRLYSIIK